uniref:Fungal lipase-type domain-containing protein n=1 Tax=Ditylum brightwellii TaxID=49249 RepID=A0A7S2EAD6_9STRA|mmetsp:Transcript_2161/g.3417  ORF Transcript_2161/g.3417 Transcript_2161/m.3417 type:complete len:473 (+) Transcript_2161:305-1723(+)
MADPMLDMCTLIYPVSFLRLDATKNLEKFRESKGITSDDFTVMKAFHIREQALLEELKKGNMEKQEEYKKVSDKIKSLKETWELSDGDWNIFVHNTDILSLPKRATEIKSDMVINADNIKPLLVAFGGEDYNVSAVESLVKRCGNCTLAYFDDDFAQYDLLGVKSELVYGIFVAKTTKKITVAFRGSVNGSDWIQNFQANAVDFELPETTDPDKKTYGKVHKGFYNYLFERKQEDGKVMPSKADEIMQKLHVLLKDYPGFDVYFTGHSLGGALSTMMAFRAAVDDELSQKTVYNVSFASPFFGDQGVRDEFYRLEGQKKIRHLRISNDDDVVPLIPFMTLFSPPGMAYKHVGLNVRLYPRSSLSPIFKSFRFFYPKPGDWVNSISNAIHNNLLLGITFKALPNHLCPEYRARLDDAEVGLSKKFLEVLYEDEDIVGRLPELTSPETSVPALTVGPESSVPAITDGPGDKSED